MKFLTFAFLLASVATLTSGLAIRDDAAAREVLARDTEASGSVPVLIEIRAGGCPGIPKNAADDEWHVLLRLDTRSITYVGNTGKDKKPISMDGLNQVIKQMGGRHHDVLVGKKKDTCYVYELVWSGNDWKDKKDADGAAIMGRQGTYSAISGEKVPYMGSLGKTFSPATANTKSPPIPISSHATYLKLT